MVGMKLCFACIKSVEKNPAKDYVVVAFSEKFGEMFRLMFNVK